MEPKILRDKAVLQELLDMLTPGPIEAAKIHIIGILRNTLCGLTFFEAVVDDWPDYSAVVMRLSKDHQDIKSLRDFRAIYGKDNEKLVDLLKHPGVIEWQKRILFCELPMGPLNAVQQVAKENNCELSWNGDGVVIHNITMPPTKPLPDGFYMAGLKPEHASLVHDTWPLKKGRDTEELVAYTIEHFPTLCVYNENDEPVSWDLYQFDGTWGMAYTMPDYRRKGFAKAIWTEAIKFSHKMGQLYYGSTGKNNVASITIIKSLGGQVLAEGVAGLYVDSKPIAERDVQT